MKFNASAEVVEVNRYDFVVEAETKEEADKKLKSFLKNHCPHPSDETIDGVTCHDREAAMETRNVVSTTIKGK